jgi:hypothetical protein
MQVYNKTNSIGIKTFLWFAAVLFIAYLPVSSFVFFIKNDAFNGYFPPRFFMSESIHAGHLPLWNPYINFGFPQYGDMSGGYWSPITWLIAATIGYNAYTFTIEILLYILAGGLGMYKLAGRWCSNRTVCAIAGISFMSCGFNIGHLQHVNWLSGAAFLLWCIFFYLRLRDDPSLKNILITAVLFYLFISSAHPTLIISAFYFFFALTLFSIFNNEDHTGWKNKALSYVRTNAALTAAVLLLSTGLIISYLDILPHFVRGQKINLAASLKNSVSFQSQISMLLPFTTVKNDALFRSDVAMRNNYMGLVALLFILTALFGKKTRWQWFFLITALVFLLLSAGGIFKTAAYYALPMMSYVRLNGIYSIIAITCLLLFAGIELNKFIAGNKRFAGSLRIAAYLLAALIASGILYGLIHVIRLHESIVYNLHSISAAASFPLKMKALIDGISFYDTFWIQGSVQFFLLACIAYSLKRKKFRLLFYICMADMVIASLLNIPFTGAGKASVADVQHILNKTPPGIPIPKMQPIVNNDTMNVMQNGLTGNWSMYSKQPGVTQEVPYPITLTDAKKYFDTLTVTPALSHMHDALLFVEDSVGSTVPEIMAYDPGKITFRAYSPAGGTMVIQQNSYPYWYYDNGQEVRAAGRAGINFMSAPLSKGDNRITLFFDPKKVKAGMLISLVSFCLAISIIMLLSCRRPK